MALRHQVGDHRFHSRRGAGAGLGPAGLRFLGIQVLLAITLWKIGGLFGALWGAIAGANRGLESRVANRYQYYLEQGTWALVARVGRYHAPLARGVLIESGAFDIRNVEGSFVARPGSAATNQTTRKGASSTVKNIWMSKT